MELKRPKRKELESVHTIKLKKVGSNDCVLAVNGADLDTSWPIMVTVSRVVIAVLRDTSNNPK